MSEIEGSLPLLMVTAYFVLVTIALMYKDKLSSAIRTLMDGARQRNAEDQNREAGAEAILPSAPQRSADVNDYRFVLGRVGFVVIVVGSMILCYALYSIGTSGVFQAGFRMFAVACGLIVIAASAGFFFIPGIFLLRGSLALARVVTVMAVVALVGCAGRLLVLPLFLPQLFLPPPELLLTAFRLAPVGSATELLTGTAFILLFLWLSLWIYRQLRSAAVLAARAAAGRTTKPPSVAFGLSTIVVVIIAVIMRVFLGGDVITKALQMAEARLGQGYKYHVATIHVDVQSNSRRVAAIVTAYNTHEIRTIPVEWTEMTSRATVAQSTETQRAALYEEVPGNPKGLRHDGSATWRFEPVRVENGQVPEVVVRADVNIPDRHLHMTMSVRRNTDRTVLASHVVELKFDPTADPPYEKITSIPRMLMKQDSQTPAERLFGQTVMVSAGVFSISLSGSREDKERNAQLLNEWPWIYIPVVCESGSRAILVIEKGPVGKRLIATAMTDWDQPLSPGTESR